MKVALEKTFPMPGDVQAVWGVLQNIEGVAGCMPGAKITERIDDTHFKGTVAVKVGPASMSFKGDIEVKELDAAKHTLRLIGKGSDTSGTSGATMDLTARVEAGAEAGSSKLIGISEVTMNGKAAAFGGRMMGSVADQILQQFAGNFGKKVAQAAPATMITASAAAPPVVPTLAPVSTPSQSVPTPAEANSAEPENKLNALALVWAIIRDGFRNLFRRKPA
jgi:carbon monoxide dehydrogenase subunit G